MLYNVGSINIDHLYRVDHFVAPGETKQSSSYQQVLGGKGANQSIAAARAGLATRHIGNLHPGDAQFLSLLEQSGVNLDSIRQLAHCASGHAIIQVNEAGENCILLHAGANHQLQADQLEQALSAAGTDDWLLLQNETNGLADAIAIAKQRGMRVAFNPAPMADNVIELNADSIDLLIVNEVEAYQYAQLCGQPQNELRDLINYFSSARAGATLITVGTQGCYFVAGANASHAQSIQVYVPAFSVAAVDSTGAGDTFIGYFLAAYCQLQNTRDMSALNQALRRAAAASALCVQTLGAAVSIPEAEAVDAFLTAHPSATNTTHQ